MAMHHDLLAVSHLMLDGPNDLQENIEVCSMIVPPTEVVVVDTICSDTNLTLIKLFGKVAEATALVDSVPTVRMLSGLLQTEDRVNVIFLL
jgi:hypothetical protein